MSSQKVAMPHVSSNSNHHHNNNNNDTDDSKSGTVLRGCDATSCVSPCIMHNATTTTTTTTTTSHRSQQQQPTKLEDQLTPESIELTGRALRSLGNQPIALPPVRPQATDDSPRRPQQQQQQPLAGITTSGYGSTASPARSPATSARQESSSSGGSKAIGPSVLFVGSGSDIGSRDSSYGGVGLALTGSAATGVCGGVIIDRHSSSQASPTTFEIVMNGEAVATFVKVPESAQHHRKCKSNSTCSHSSGSSTGGGGGGEGGGEDGGGRGGSTSSRLYQSVNSQQSNAHSGYQNSTSTSSRSSSRTNEARRRGGGGGGGTTQQQQQQLVSLTFVPSSEIPAPAAQHSLHSEKVSAVAVVSVGETRGTPECQLHPSPGRTSSRRPPLSRTSDSLSHMKKSTSASGLCGDVVSGRGAVAGAGGSTGVTGSSLLGTAISGRGQGVGLAGVSGKGHSSRRVSTSSSHGGASVHHHSAHYSLMPLEGAALHGGGGPGATESLLIRATPLVMLTAVAASSSGSRRASDYSIFPGTQPSGAAAAAAPGGVSVSSPLSALPATGSASAAVATGGPASATTAGTSATAASHMAMPNGSMSGRSEAPTSGAGPRKTRLSDVLGNEMRSSLLSFSSGVAATSSNGGGGACCPRGVAVRGGSGGSGIGASSLGLGQGGTTSPALSSIVASPAASASIFGINGSVSSSGTTSPAPTHAFGLSGGHGGATSSNPATHAVLSPMVSGGGLGAVITEATPISSRLDSSDVHLTGVGTLGSSFPQQQRPGGAVSEFVLLQQRKQQQQQQQQQLGTPMKTPPSRISRAHCSSSPPPLSQNNSQALHMGGAPTITVNGGSSSGPINNNSSNATANASTSSGLGPVVNTSNLNGGQLYSSPGKANGGGVTLKNPPPSGVGSASPEEGVCGTSSISNRRCISGTGGGVGAVLGIAAPSPSVASPSSTTGGPDAGAAGCFTMTSGTITSPMITLMTQNSGTRRPLVGGSAHAHGSGLDLRLPAAAAAGGGRIGVFTATPPAALGHPSGIVSAATPPPTGPGSTSGCSSSSSPNRLVQNGVGSASYQENHTPQRHQHHYQQQQQQHHHHHQRPNHVKSYASGWNDDEEGEHEDDGDAGPRDALRDTLEPSSSPGFFSPSNASSHLRRARSNGGGNALPTSTIAHVGSYNMASCSSSSLPSPKPHEKRGQQHQQLYTPPEQVQSRRSFNSDSGKRNVVVNGSEPSNCQDLLLLVSGRGGASGGGQRSTPMRPLTREALGGAGGTKLTPRRGCTSPGAALAIGALSGAGPTTTASDCRSPVGHSDLNLSPATAATTAAAQTARSVANSKMLVDSSGDYGSTTAAATERGMARHSSFSTGSTSRAESLPVIATTTNSSSSSPAKVAKGLGSGAASSGKLVRRKLGDTPCKVKGETTIVGGRASPSIVSQQPATAMSMKTTATPQSMNTLAGKDEEAGGSRVLSPRAPVGKRPPSHGGGRGGGAGVLASSDALVKSHRCSERGYEVSVPDTSGAETQRYTSTPHK